LTGAVSSQSVTEECEGGLKPDLPAVERKGTCPPDGQTDRSRRDAKVLFRVGPSDPMADCGIAIAQRIKGTLGITG